MYNGGYTGKVLRVNLTEQSAKVEDLAFETARDFVGGAGFCLKYLYDEVKAGSDPLGPDNKLIFTSGPFTGTTIPCASRMAVGGKSPLTNAAAVSLTGGHFPAELKFAGFDALIIEGKAEKPTYISIKDGEVKFRSATKLWGLKTTDCQQIIKNELHDQNTRVSCIGPAGENLSRIAAIINELRAAGRKGLGAVMGSKNLKAIAVRGSGSISVASKEKYKEARGVMTKAMKDHPGLYPGFGNTGTGMAVDLLSHMGIFPGKNFSATGEFLPADKIGEEPQRERTIGKESCYNCPVGCSQMRLAKNGPYAGILAEGPEFETLYSFGGMTGVDDIDSIIAADRLTDELGMDSISAGATIAFAMELYEKGILGPDKTDGLELDFGNHESMITLLKLMAFRKGIGDTLADGTRIAAEKIGQGSEKYAMHVKGLELPGYDVRGAKGHGMNYATAYTGADHNKGYAIQEIMGAPIPVPADRFSTENKGMLTKWNQDIQTAMGDCPTICSFVALMILIPAGGEMTANLLSAVTGIEYAPDDIMKIGERVNNLARAFNVREGFTRADDTLPERILTEPLKAGVAKGHFISKDEFKIMLDEYYTKRGWDLTTGIPTKEKLTELGLEYVADDLSKIK